MLKKSFYEAPEAELLLVKFEENFCNSLKSESIQTLEYDEDDPLNF
jgi:hypothetical protein